MRIRYVMCPERLELIPAHEYYEPKKQTHHVITDEIDGLYNHGDGKYYTSKHRLREENRRLGLVEVGSEMPTRAPQKMRSAAEDILRAEAELSSPERRADIMGEYQRQIETSDLGDERY